MTACQLGYGTNAAEDQTANDTQYNTLVAQFKSGYSSAQGSTINLTATNISQHQQISALQMQVLQSTNNVEHVTYCLSVQHTTM